MLFENIETALSSIRSNKMRSFLTMLGILIGMAAIIAIIMVGNGMSKSVEESMKEMGSNRMEFYVSQKDWEKEVTKKSSDYLSPEMIRDVSVKFKNQIEKIALSSTLGEGVVKNKKAYAKVSVSGSNSGAIKIKDENILAGRKITREEQQQGRLVAMVSDKFVKNLYKGDNDAAVGQTMDVLINNKYYTFTIAGVYKSYEQGKMTTSAYDAVSTVYIPLKAVHKVVPNAEQMDSVDIYAASGTDAITLAGQITDYLNERYYSKNENFTIGNYTMQSEAKQANKQVKMIESAMGGVGAISLLVGGIGVMNIMIVSITERTREIGTRKALGATNFMILSQFILEAVIICLLGGLLGLGLGIILGHYITAAIGFPGAITLQNIFFCLLFSVGFGVFFGYYPARKAAKMNPIDALRYE